MISLPVIPRLRRAITDDEIEEFYLILREKVFQAAANSILQCYESQPLKISTFFE